MTDTNRWTLISRECVSVCICECAFVCLCVQACVDQRCQHVSVFRVDECRGQCYGHGVSPAGLDIYNINVLMMRYMYSL